MEDIMRHSDFVIGQGFMCGRKIWLCTDTGRRTISAIELSPNQKLSSWKQFSETTVIRDSEPSDFFGPPYKIAEQVFDEEDVKGCEQYDHTKLAYFRK